MVNRVFHLNKQPPLVQSICIAATTLGVFALLCSSLLSLTHWATADAITKSERAVLLSSLQAIISAELFDNDLITDTIQISDPLLGTSEPVDVYRARLGTQNIAAILSPIAPNGYNGTINLLVGIYSDGTIAGVRVTSHKETPGLGDDIETKKSSWILNFNGKSLQTTPESSWQVIKDGGDFDQFTGATITPRAVINTVHDTLKYFHKHPQLVFTSPLSTTTQ